MKEDSASNLFSSERIKEITEDNFAIEREETIGRLVKEIAEVSAEKEKLE